MNRWTPLAAAATLLLLGACAKPGLTSGAAGTGSPSGGPTATTPASPPVSPPVSAGSGGLPGSPPASLRPKPSDATIPATATALSAQMTAAGLGAVTDKNVFGPVRVSDASRVAQVAALINARPVSPLGVHPCPLTAHGGTMTLQFADRAGGAAVVTAVIELDGCPGILVTPTGHAPVVLEGDATQADQVITLLGLDWPHQ
ncbi:MAG TPA: hypothetical protein VKB69_10990 [Micromonosporaceae bacterium]|nr:hypothetical protein [Micromonosporaceae bacterium]